MSMTMRVTMELLSDAIFGSGFSVPGGEDVAVCRDAQGYPYLKGSTLKGLLRESLENLSAWTGAGSADAEALLGVSGWDGTGEARRVHLTALLVGSTPAGELYANRQREACAAVGIDYELRTLPADAESVKVADTIKKLNADASVTGIMLHLPLPRLWEMKTAKETRPG